MKKKMCMVCIMLFVASGCMPAQTVANFRGKRIVVGQSNDSVEKQLGQPDWVATGYRMKMAQHFTGYSPGTQTIEWGYRDEMLSLVLWLDYGMVRALWHMETSKLK